ncbi:unnamed protein product [Protopolystoma xenopodis]|uniref:Uncharacterized protein n=1 Tax=Protopolystoma xenopodis TaxID=117903 RepID=A0A448XLB5_9PLAT|nr:unnamed protein product [Protopolystoma xenopodis]
MSARQGAVILVHSALVVGASECISCPSSRPTIAFNLATSCPPSLTQSSNKDLRTVERPPNDQYHKDLASAWLLPGHARLLVCLICIADSWGHFNDCIWLQAQPLPTTLYRHVQLHQQQQQIPVTFDLKQVTDPKAGSSDHLQLTGQCSEILVAQLIRLPVNFSVIGCPLVFAMSALHCSPQSPDPLLGISPESDPEGSTTLTSNQPRFPISPRDANEDKNSVDSNDNIRDLGDPIEAMGQLAEKRIATPTGEREKSSDFARIGQLSALSRGTLQRHSGLGLANESDIELNSVPLFFMNPVPPDLGIWRQATVRFGSRLLASPTVIREVRIINRGPFDLPN